MPLKKFKKKSTDGLFKKNFDHITESANSNIFGNNKTLVKEGLSLVIDKKSKKNAFEVGLTVPLENFRDQD